MAGLNRTITYTFKVKDASGVTVRRFARPIASTDGLTLEACMPTAANQMCVGVFADDMDNLKGVGIWGQPGDILIVDGDGTCAVGDQVTNDADGKATPIPLASTPASYWSHGIVVEKNTEDDTVKIIYRPIQYEA